MSIQWSSAITHPDPDEPVAFDQRIGGHARAGGNCAAAMRVGNTRARRVELQTVIRTLNGAGGIDDATVQRCEAMRAPVADRDRAAARITIDDNRLVKHAPSERLLSNMTYHALRRKPPCGVTRVRRSASVGTSAGRRP
jgi:hypothetical protein